MLEDVDQADRVNFDEKHDLGPEFVPLTPELQEHSPTLLSGLRDGEVPPLDTEPQRLAYGTSCS